VAGSCKHGDEPSGSGAIELIINQLLSLASFVSRRPMSNDK
jgi:hypothetical protein